MISIFKYETQEEADAIIDREVSSGKVLIEVQNITVGNFLGFNSTTPQLIQANDIPQSLVDIQNTLDIMLLKQEGII